MRWIVCIITFEVWSLGSVTAQEPSPVELILRMPSLSTENDKLSSFELTADVPVSDRRDKLLCKMRIDLVWSRKGGGKILARDSATMAPLFLFAEKTLIVYDPLLGKLWTLRKISSSITLKATATNMSLKCGFGRRHDTNFVIDWSNLIDKQFVQDAAIDKKGGNGLVRVSSVSVSKRSIILVSLDPTSAYPLSCLEVLDIKDERKPLVRLSILGVNHSIPTEDFRMPRLDACRDLLEEYPSTGKDDEDLREAAERLWRAMMARMAIRNTEYRANFVSEEIDWEAVSNKDLAVRPRISDLFAQAADAN
jgi:hypothetical protein